MVRDAAAKWFHQIKQDGLLDSDFGLKVVLLDGSANAFAWKNEKEPVTWDTCASSWRSPLKSSQQDELGR